MLLACSDLSIASSNSSGSPSLCVFEYKNDSNENQGKQGNSLSLFTLSALEWDVCHHIH